MKNRKDYYQRMKRRARNSAIWYQHNFEDIMKTSAMSVTEWTEHFRKLGKRYGLTEEFKENGII